MATTDTLSTIRTPARGFAPIGAILSGQRVPHWAASLGIRWSRRHGKPFRFGTNVIAARHQDVRETLRRDLDFLIAPVNEQRIEEVNHGPFVLGMDRSEQLMRERRALYSAMEALDLSELQREIHADAYKRLSKCSNRFDAITDYARPIAAGTAARLFGVGAAEDELFKEAIRSIFAHTFLNLGGDEKVRERAVLAGDLMKQWFCEEMARRKSSGNFGTDMMGRLLEQALLDDDGIRRTLGGMLVGSIDTTTSALAKIIVVVDRDTKLRAQMKARWVRGQDIYGLCQEALRLYPHNPILLREAGAATHLGKTKVEQGDRVIAWTQAAMLDPEAFPDPTRLDPMRADNAYLHFGAGLHPCAGRAVNRLQIPVLIGLLLEGDFRRAGRIRYAGPFPDVVPVRIQPKEPS